ncbi:MAG: hypothetical protein M0Z54_04435 [Thermaerobacter sp.]|nr:hypothetical protein [Thermaerobacter sp.]
MSTPKQMEARWQVLIVVWALIGIVVPGGLFLSIAIAIWLAGQHSPYFWFFVIAVAAGGLVIAGLGLAGLSAVSFHSGVGHSTLHAQLADVSKLPGRAGSSAAF